MAKRLAYNVINRERLTNAGHYLAKRLREYPAPVITAYELNKIITKMYAAKHDQPLYLRKTASEEDRYARHRDNLRDANIIRSDEDYSRAHFILSASDLPAEEIACIVDPLCCVAFMSAMQRWGLTNRSPKSLLLMKPSRGRAKEAIQAQMEEDGMDETSLPLTNVSHPHYVRGRHVSVTETNESYEAIKLRGSNVRITTIGQTFLDTLRFPEQCGGMQHVISVWENTIEDYLETVIDTINRTAKPIVLMRAGYILDEILDLEHAVVEKWSRMAQRGGSRKLDPHKPFKSTYSEKWMISLNA